MEVILCLSGTPHAVGSSRLPGNLSARVSARIEMSRGRLWSELVGSSAAELVCYAPNAPGLGVGKFNRCRDFLALGSSPEVWDMALDQDVNEAISRPTLWHNAPVLGPSCTSATCAAATNPGLDSSSIGCNEAMQ